MAFKPLPIQKTRVQISLLFTALQATEKRHGLTNPPANSGHKTFYPKISRMCASSPLDTMQTSSAQPIPQARIH
ncbi:hypothetical protein N7488_002302 [Penicillium malachiteum]|nr:hypothetical protein N7488_002302 [Penicillium malachiteum]